MTKKEYLTKMVEECFDVTVESYDASNKTVELEGSNADGTGRMVFVDAYREKDGTVDLKFTPSCLLDINPAKLNKYMEDRGTTVYNWWGTTETGTTFWCDDYPWHNYTTEGVEPETVEQPKAKPEILEIARLREENRDLKQQIKELEAECRAWNDYYDKDDKPCTCNQSRTCTDNKITVHFVTLPFFSLFY